MGWKIGKIIGDIWKHGMNSKYLSDVQDMLKAASAEYLGTGLSPAQEAMNQFNSNEAEKARQFEEEMSGTSYQRGVADMQAAGVNPALVYGKGASGASTPSGAQASATAAPSAFDLFGLISSLTMQNRQLSVQKEIADNNNQTAKDIAEMQAGVTIGGQQIQWVEVLQGIDESNARIAKLAAETDNEIERNGLIKLQAHIAELDDQAKALYIENYNRVLDAELKLKQAQTDAEKAAASRDYAQAVATKVESDFKQKLYASEDWFDAQIKNAVLSADMIDEKIQSENLSQYWQYCRSCLVAGRIPGEYNLEIDGSKKIIIPEWSDSVANNLSRAMGCYGPTMSSHGYNWKIGPFGDSYNYQQSYDHPF